MTMTTTASPTPLRLHDPLDAVMRSCLRDDAVWAEITTTPAGLNQAEHWLKTTASSIDQQLSFRQDDAEIWRLSPLDHSAQLIEFLEWRKGALYLKSLCEKRLIDIKRLRTADEERAEEMKVLLVRLAETVVAHEGKLIGDEDLYGALDRLSLPGTDAPTLREYLRFRVGSKD
ncbi:hypothetical protein ACFUTU_12790 [Arthrobacter sp. NPDC057388]|uniref:hypothetical protein n=1 Tax=Arthrobacter sp. NPDC057388 TaxID=3346116 RepID=UPI0036343E3A